MEGFRKMIHIKTPRWWRSRGKAHCYCGKEIPDEQYFEEENRWIAIQYCSQKCKDEDSK